MKFVLDKPVFIYIWNVNTFCGKTYQHIKEGFVGKQMTKTKLEDAAAKAIWELKIWANA